MTYIITPTQILILAYAARDFSDRQIASELGISASMVDWHWRWIRKRTDARTRLGALMNALRNPVTSRKLLQAYNAIVNEKCI